jgi:hypothetical protein
MLDTSGLDVSVRSTVHVWRTDLAGDNRQEVTTIAAPGWCECTTGVCSESCPQWSLWAPSRVVDEFFLATRMTEGQTESTYQESVLYQRAGSRWVTQKMPHPLEAPLGASRNGEMLITAVLDAGCCGWENESSDLLLLLKSAKSSVIYDEARRYDNHNYDVSFYASDAQLSADNTLVAYTLASTARPGGEIRLSDDGKENADELARVRRTITELPTVEIARLGTTPRSVASIAHAGLVGWVNAREVLVAQNGRLAICNAQRAGCRDTTIAARSAADTFLR